MPLPKSRIGFLVPPGNPTTEPEMIRLTPDTVGVYFNRMVARGVTGSHDGQEERNLSQIANLDTTVEMLALVKPQVIVLAHTATSYMLGQAAKLVQDEHARWGEVARRAGLQPQ